MAFSHRRDTGGWGCGGAAGSGFSAVAGRCAACVLLVLAILTASPLCAWGEGLGQQPEEAVEISSVSAQAFWWEHTAQPGETLQLPRFCPVQATAACSPEAIEAGIDCGMDWMCGIQPCLCGSADAWGGCSCNGLETVQPQVSVASSDESVVQVREFMGHLWLVPMGPGTAQISCTAQLRYFSDGAGAFTVEVGSVTAADGMLLATLALAVVLVLAAVLAVRALLKARGRK